MCTYASVVVGKKPFADSLTPSEALSESAKMPGSRVLSCLSNSIRPPVLLPGSPSRKGKENQNFKTPPRCAKGPNGCSPKPTPEKADEFLASDEFASCRREPVWIKLFDEIRENILAVTSRVGDTSVLRRNLFATLLQKTQITISLEDQESLDAQLTGIPHWRSLFLRDVAREYMVHAAKLLAPESVNNHAQRVDMARYRTLPGSPTLFLNPNLITIFQDNADDILSLVKRFPMASYGAPEESRQFSKHKTQQYFRLPLVSLAERSGALSCYSGMVPLDGFSNWRYSYISTKDSRHKSYAALNREFDSILKKVSTLSGGSGDYLDQIKSEMEVLTLSFFDHNQIEQKIDSIEKLMLIEEKSIVSKSRFLATQALIRRLIDVLIDLRGCLTCELAYSTCSLQKDLLTKPLKDIQDSGTPAKGGLAEVKHELFYSPPTDVSQRLFFGFR